MTESEKSESSKTSSSGSRELVPVDPSSSEFPSAGSKTPTSTAGPGVLDEHVRAAQTERLSGRLALACSILSICAIPLYLTTHLVEQVLLREVLGITLQVVVALIAVGISTALLTRIVAERERRGV